ncbi:MAG: hypothetical protein QXG86_03655, partial [Candidatus Woesearchaeota archaeon]
MAVTRTKTIDPWKLKRWYPIVAPSFLKKSFIGETPSISSEKVIGRCAEISLAAVTGEIKKQHINVTFRVVGFEGNNAITDIKKIEISPAYIKRNVRKGKTRVDDSFVLKTADNKEVRIKPFIISKDRINNTKQTLLRKLTKTELKEYVTKTSYEQLLEDILSYKLQKLVINILKKVCPIKTFEIRVIELIGETKENTKTE